MIDGIIEAVGILEKKRQGLAVDPPLLPVQTVTPPPAEETPAGTTTP
jgi:hypothetical protein